MKDIVYLATLAGKVLCLAVFVSILKVQSISIVQAIADAGGPTSP